MKLTLFLTFILSPSFAVLYAQAESIKQPGEEYIKYIHNPQTHTTNLSYDYSNMWDIDGDSKKDSLLFIGNGGAHSYFFLRIILSIDHKVRDFPFIQLDMPYITDRTLFKELGKNISIQFVPSDFNNDGTIDLYLNFDNSFSKLPKRWKKKGIRTRNVIMSFKEAKLEIRTPNNLQGGW